jgi:hypothetical protein
VFLDGKQLLDATGRPLNITAGEIVVPAGAHRVRFENPCCEPVERAVIVSADGPVPELAVAFTRYLPAQIAFAADPPGEIWIRGLLAGQSTEPIPVKPAHLLGEEIEVELRRAGRPVVRRRVTLVPGDRMKVDFGRGP